MTHVLEVWSDTHEVVSHTWVSLSCYPNTLRSAVKERVVWVDTKRTRVKGRTGKLKEKEVTVLEMRVKAQHPGEPQSQEVIYSTESHTDRSFCRSGVDILPWRHTQPGGHIEGVKQFHLTLLLEQSVYFI